jgi:Ferritin-like domain
VHQIPSPSRSADVALLNHALDLEHQAIAVYTAGIPLLSGKAHAAAKHFLNQELDHAGELAGLIKQAGGKGDKPPVSYDFGHPRSAADILSLLHRVEREQIAAYLQITPSLSPGPVRAAVSTVLANDAQHLAVVRASLGLESTTPLVTGVE